MAHITSSCVVSSLQICGEAAAIVAGNTGFFSLPLYTCHVSAGFPSPADDHLEPELNLHTHLVQHPAATFFLRAKGDEWRQQGIVDGSILVVDRSLPPSPGSMVVATWQGDLVVRQLVRQRGQCVLMCATGKTTELAANAGEVWGVVTSAIRQF